MQNYRLVRILNGIWLMPVCTGTLPCLTKRRESCSLIDLDSENEWPPVGAAFRQPSFIGAS